jgi:hypothetical protein
MSHDIFHTVLTDKERKALDRGLKEYGQGKTRTLDEVRNARDEPQTGGHKKRPKVHR